MHLQVEMSSGAPPEDAVPVVINGQTVDPLETYAKDSKHTDYIVITAYKVLGIAEEEELLALAVGILEDLGDNNFLCYYPLDDLAPIRAKEFVRQVDVYRNSFKIPEALRIDIEQEQSLDPGLSDGRNSASEPITCMVDILAHDEVKDQDFEALKDFIASTAGVPIDEMEVAPGKVRLCIESDKLTQLAKDDRVRIIEEVIEAELMCSDSRSIVGGTVGIGGSAFRGKGQIVTVSDTGFDIGSREDCHPAFTDKVLALMSIARSNRTDLSEQNRSNDPHGHGTHVSGIILGQNFSTSEGQIGGIAPDAKLILQSLYEKEAKPVAVPVDLNKLFSVPYAQGSRIFSNSWGVGFSTKQPDYADPAKVIDNFVRDNPDALVCFSAGNDNVKAAGMPAVGLHAGAKNVLTVGASGNTNAPDQMNDTSSVGPTKEKRLKPDVIAPGTDIYSALSRKARYFGRIATSQSEPGFKWKPLSGTSQATPLVAGCAAVLCEILQSKGCKTPPAALLKAVIINGADKLPGLDPNAQGHGRVNLQASSAILNTPPVLSKDTSINVPLSMSEGTLIGDALKQDDEHEFALLAIDSGNTHTHFKITMVYNDIGNKQIQNNLNLFVADTSTNQVIPGNDKSLTDIDTQNNVEQIILSSLPKDGLRVRVHAQKILAQQLQDYALAWSVFTPIAGAVF